MEIAQALVIREMKIKTIEIRNIRMIENEILDFSSSSEIVYIGKNNDGKTSMLKGIEFFFSQESKGEELYPKNEDGTLKKDLEAFDSGVIIKFEVSEEDLADANVVLEDQKHASAFSGYVQNGEVFIGKFLTLKNGGKFETLQYKLSTDGIDFKSVFGGPGSKNFSKLLPKYFFLPSIANVDDYNQSAQKAKNSFSDLFEIYLESKSWEDDAEIKKLVDTLRTKIFSKLKFNEAGDKLTTYISDIIPSVKSVKLDSYFKEVKDLNNLLKKVDGYVNDGTETLISEKGMGTQRAYIFSLLRLIAEEINKKTSKEVIFLLDEPDMHLHPEAQKETAKTISRLAEAFKVVIATHSHLFINKKNGNLIVKKIEKNGQKVTTAKILQKDEILRELFIYLGFVPSDFLIPDNYFFVEGKFDKLYLEKLIELMDLECEHEICIQSCCGDDGVKRWIKNLGGIDKLITFFQGIPCYEGRFCALLDSSASKSITNLRTLAGDNEDEHKRINALDKNGIEYFYPVSLLKKYFEENESFVGEIDDLYKELEKRLADDELKAKLSKFTLENMKKEHLSEINSLIIDSVRLAVAKCG